MLTWPSVCMKNTRKASVARKHSAACVVFVMNNGVSFSAQIGGLDQVDIPGSPRGHVRFASVL